MKRTERGGGLWALLQELIADWFGPMERSHRKYD